MAMYDRVFAFQSHAATNHLNGGTVSLEKTLLLFDGCGRVVVVVVVVVYRLNVVIGNFRDDFLLVRRPNQQCQSTEGNQLVVEIRLESHQNHSTMLQ